MDIREYLMNNVEYSIYDKYLKRYIDSYINSYIRQETDYDLVENNKDLIYELNPNEIFVQKRLNRFKIFISDITKKIKLYPYIKKLYYICAGKND